MAKLLRPGRLVDTTYEELVALLGKPTNSQPSPDGKVRVEWRYPAFAGLGGLSVYDYCQWDRPVEQVTEWSVSGKKDVQDNLVEKLELQHRGFTPKQGMPTLDEVFAVKEWVELPDGDDEDLTNLGYLGSLLNQVDWALLDPYLRWKVGLVGRWLVMRTTQSRGTCVVVYDAITLELEGERTLRW